MKKLIKARFSEVYAKLNPNGGQYDVYNGKGMTIGHVLDHSDLILTASPKSFTQISVQEAINLSSVIHECKIQLSE